MQQVSDPKYDEDVVSLGYLNKVLSDDLPGQISSLTTRNYNVQPKPPYYVGDTWTQGETGDIKRCIKQRLVGKYNDSDWELASGNPSKEDLSDLLTKVELVTEQLDKKIESFYQTEDPAIDWKTSLDKEKHVGDLWYNQDTRISKVYYKEANSYEWKVRDVPSALYDEIDKKKSIYTETPSKYDKDDMWIIASADTEDIPEGCKLGDIVISNTKNDHFDKSNWSKKDNYSTTDYVDEKNNEILENLNEEINNFIPSILQTANANANNLINAFNSGEIIKINGKYYVFDGESLENSSNVLTIGAGGIGGSSTGVNGRYNTSLTNDGKINADMILVGSLIADMIRGGTLTLGGIDNKNGNFILLDQNSNEIIKMNNLGITLQNGAKLIGGNGVLSNFIFTTGNYDFLGFSNYDGTKQFLDINAYVPGNFIITEAKIVLEHAPMYWVANDTKYWGYARNVKLYKYTNSDKYYRTGNVYGGYVESDFMNLTEISGAFGTNGFTGLCPTGAPSSSMANTVSKTTSIDIKNILTPGLYNTLRIQTSLNTTTPTGDMIEKAINEKTGIAKATLHVTGYIK